jgi:hypothetical protein
MQHYVAADIVSDLLRQVVTRGNRDPVVEQNTWSCIAGPVIDVL